jgi:hypothetical protein
MNFLAYIVMFGWIPIIFYLFSRFPARQAVILGFIVAWLFLPQKEFPLLGLPDYTKMSATCYGILLATIAYDISRFSSFKFNWLDLPMLIWCLCPFASSITNGLGAYDGFSSVLIQTVTWGVPYFLGRIYLDNFTGLRQLAMGIFWGGLIYVPLCLFEIKMSPQLHRLIYGFSPYSFAQSVRYGGYRPSVFMQHGLEVGMWMMAATLIGIWLWKSGVVRQLQGISVVWPISALLMTFILVKSTGAYFLLVLGITVMFVSWQFRSSIVITLSILVISFYLGQSVLTETHFTKQIIASLQEVAPRERVNSLKFRFDNEKLLADKAKKKIAFGWGGWGRNRVYQYGWDGKSIDISVTDSLWIVAFGQNGFIGLSSVFLTFLVPTIGFLQRYPATMWFYPNVAPAAAIAVVLILYAIDSLSNALINPIFILACGGIAGVTANKSEH